MYFWVLNTNVVSKPGGSKKGEKEEKHNYIEKKDLQGVFYIKFLGTNIVKKLFCLPTAKQKRVLGLIRLVLKASGRRRSLLRNPRGIMK